MMKNFRIGISFMVALIASSATIILTGCSSDSDTPRSSVGNPAVSLDASQKAANRLAFSWGKVIDAVEYSYTLKDSEGRLIDGGLGNVLSYSNKCLLPNSEYTLAVTAYPLVANSALQGSETILLKAKTDTVNIKPVVDGSKISMSWSNLIDADYVSYTIKHKQSNRIDTLTTSSSSVEYEAQSFGDYLVSLFSYNASGTDYQISDCSHNFSFTKVSGKAYLDGIGTTIDATMTVNEDGTLTIHNWYGGTTDVTLSICSDGTVEVVNPVRISKDGRFYYAVSGRSQSSEDVYNVAVYKARSFVYDGSGNKVSYPNISHGKIALYVVLTSYEDDDIDNTSDDSMYTFTW